MEWLKPTANCCQKNKKINKKIHKSCTQWRKEQPNEQDEQKKNEQQKQGTRKMRLEK